MNLTPQATDQFARFMAAMYDDRDGMPAPGGFCSFFGHRPNGSNIVFSPDSSVVDIDIIRGNEKIAALVHRGLNSRAISGQKNTQEQSSTSQSRKYPLIEEEGDISADQLIHALAGEARYSSGKTRFDRLRMLALVIYFEQMRRQARTFEVLAASSIITGLQPAILNTTNPDLLYDFRRNSDNFFNVGTAWSDVASDILGDFDTACTLVRQNGRRKPDMAVLSSVDMDSITKNTAIKAIADNRGFELILVSTNNPVPPKFARFVENGFIARGRLLTPKGFELWLFTYIDSYQTDAGTPTDYLPANKTIVCSSEARMDLYLGPPEVLPVTRSHTQWFEEMFGFNLMAPPMPANFASTKWADLMPLATYVDAYPSVGNKTITIRTQSAPIFPTTATDTIVTITTTP